MASPRLAISRFAAQARFLSSRWFDLIPLSSDPVRGVVPAQLVLQGAEIRSLADADELDAEGAGEVLELRRGSGLAEGGGWATAGAAPPGDRPFAGRTGAVVLRAPSAPKPWPSAISR